LSALLLLLVAHKYLDIYRSYGIHVAPEPAIEPGIEHRIEQQPSRITAASPESAGGQSREAYSVTDVQMQTDRQTDRQTDN